MNENITEKQRCKRKLSERAVLAMGGRANGTSGTFIFELLQLKKILGFIVLLVVFIFTLSSNIVLFRGLPGRVTTLEVGQKKITETQIRHGIQGEFQDKKLDNMLVDIRFIREVMERRK